MMKTNFEGYFSNYEDCRLVIVLSDNDKLIGIRELGRCRIDLDSVNHHQDEEKIDAPKLIRLVCPISIAACQQHFKGEIYLGIIKEHSTSWL